MKESEVYQSELPPWITRVIGWGIICLFTIVTLVAFIAPIPETVRCPCIIIPEQQVNLVKSPCKGRIERILAAETTDALRNDVLFHIYSPDVDGWQTEFKTLEQDLAENLQHKSLLPKELETEKRSEDAQLLELMIQTENLKKSLIQFEDKKNMADKAYHASLDIIKKKALTYEDEISFRKGYSKTYKNYVSSSEKLMKKGAVSETEMMFRRLSSKSAELETSRAKQQQILENLKKKQLEIDFQNKMMEISGEKQKCQAELNRTNALISKFEQERKHNEILREIRKKEIDFNISKIEVKLAAVKNRLKQTHGNNVFIHMPYTGSVLSLAVKNEGDMVTQGQELCRIAPKGSKLRAELWLPEDALSRIAKGQQVKLLLTAFPYQRFGTRCGKVTWVSPAPLPTSDNQTFKAFVQIEDDSFIKKGKSDSLRPGMRGEARVIVGQRTLIEYVFEPLKQLKEAISIKNE